MGESSHKPVVFDIELKDKQTRSQVFMNPDIIAGLVFEHMNVLTFSGTEAGYENHTAGLPRR